MSLRINYQFLIGDYCVSCMTKGTCGAYMDEIFVCKLSV